VRPCSEHWAAAAVVDRCTRQSSIEIYICTDVRRMAILLFFVVRKSSPFARMGRWSSAFVRPWFSSGGIHFSRRKSYTAINLHPFTKTVRGRKRRTTVTAVTFCNLGLTGGRGDLNRYTNETCTAYRNRCTMPSVGTRRAAAVESNIY